MRSCDQTCSWCANNFFQWWKAREAVMSVPKGAKIDKKTKKVLRPAETTTFMQAVETAIRA